MEYDVRTRKIATASMWFGVSAMMLYQIVVLPVAATVVGVVALRRAGPARQGKWMAWVGVSLGAVYLTLAVLHHLRVWALIPS